MKTVGECLEYMIKNKIIEVLCAYSMSDKPGGFFKFGLETLSDMISGLRSISILSNSTVHPGVNSLLRCICSNIKNWQFNENKPDLEQIRELEPNIYEASHEVLEFINCIAKKVCL